MKRHEGKRVVITGGTSGIGLTTAKLLVEQGARVLVTGTSTLKDAVESLGKSAIVVESDAASLGEIDKLVVRTMAELGGVDLLFVNAGITRFAPVEAMTEAVYDEVFGVNAKGAFFTVQKIAPLMPEGSAVVATTSVVNEMGLPMLSAYSASKAALRSMVRTFAVEFLPRGIRVNAVSPGPTDTGILEKMMPMAAAEQTKQQMRETTPMRRLGRPDEIAKAVEFLAFDATFTTGAELVVDGGGSQL